MTQALNLANFANNLNTSGATSNAGLQNSSVTVTAGTGMSGGGPVALGASVTLTNTGVTSVTAGTGIGVSASTGGVTITNTTSPPNSATLAKAWVNFGYDGATTTVYASYNVTSVTRTGTGNYTINFTSAFVDANYATALSCGSYSASVGLGIGVTMTSPTGTPVNKTTTSLSVTVATNIAYDSNNISVICFR